MTGTRNPSRKYFKRNQPYFYKSADNWEEWDTDESYDRTFFIGIDDSNPKDIDVALYMIWGGKAVAVVGSKVLDTVSGVVDTARQLETEIQSILKEVQELSAKVAQSAIDIEQAITEMNALVDRCEGILEGAEAARDLAKDWATKMNGTVDGTEYSAKYYANEAKNSETAAAGSASNASASATTATEQAAAAATSASQSATSASTAASYASTAHIDASGAANSAQAAQDSATSAANSATNAANSATASAQSATSSATSANNSHIWAEGTDAQVQALGGVHSSKVWAKQSTNANVSLSNLSAAGQAKFDAKADTSLSNLNAAGQAKFDAKANTDLGNLSTAGQAILNGKANTDASNFTAAGKKTVVGWGMAGYFSKPRVFLKSGVWNHADKNIFVTALCNKDLQGYIYVNKVPADDAQAIASCCVTPATGGISCSQIFIRKGIYYKAVFNNLAWYDELMEG